MAGVTSCKNQEFFYVLLLLLLLLLLLFRSFTRYVVNVVCKLGIKPRPKALGV